MFCIDTSGCSGQVAVETLYSNLNVKDFYGDKVAIATPVILSINITENHMVHIANDIIFTSLH